MASLFLYSRRPRSPSSKNRRTSGSFSLIVRGVLLDVAVGFGVAALSAPLSQAVSKQANITSALKLLDKIFCGGVEFPHFESLKDITGALQLLFALNKETLLKQEVPIAGKAVSKL